jgi:hypothetical protein
MPETYAEQIAALKERLRILQERADAPRQPSTAGVVADAYSPTADPPDPKRRAPDQGGRTLGDGERLPAGYHAEGRSQVRMSGG